MRARKGATPITMLALYDAQMARIAEAAGINIILVGDSLGMAVQGMESTAQVTLEQIIYHARAVRRGAPHTHVVGDLPFMTYQVSDEQAVANAGRLVAEASVDSVNLKVGRQWPIAFQPLRAGIPVMAHVGLLPQTAQVQGGFKVQGRDPEGARQLSIRFSKPATAMGPASVGQTSCWSGVGGKRSSHEIRRTAKTPPSVRCKHYDIFRESDLQLTSAERDNPLPTIRL